MTLQICAFDMRCKLSPSHMTDLGLSPGLPGRGIAGAVLMAAVVVAGFEILLGERADIAALESCRDELADGIHSAYLPPHTGSQVASNSSGIATTILTAQGRCSLAPSRRYRRIHQQSVCGYTAEPS